MVTIAQEKLQEYIWNTFIIVSITAAITALIFISVATFGIREALEHTA